MSKKLAEGAGALVLDVKVGSRGVPEVRSASPASWRTPWSSWARRTGVPTRALLTDMNCPLGATVGNALEVAESLEVLAGGGPADVVELTVRLAAEMLDLAGIDGRDPAQTLRDGTAMDRFRAAGGRPGRRFVATVADRCAFRDRDGRPGRHNGRYRRDGSGAGGVAARRGQIPAGRAGAARRRRADPPPARGARRRR